MGLDEDHPWRAASLNNLAAIDLLHGDYLGREGVVRGGKRRLVAIPGAEGSARRRRPGESGHAPLRRRRAGAGRAGPGRREGHLPGVPAEGQPGLDSELDGGLRPGAAAGAIQRAQRDAENALTLLEKTLGQQHPYMAPALDALAAVAVDQARYAQVYVYAFRSVALVKRLWGQGHPFLAMSLDRLAAVEIAQGRPADAEPLCRQALAIVLQVFGAKHPWAGAVDYTWGRLEIARKAPRDARPHLERAREVFDETLGGAHPQSIRARRHRLAGRQPQPLGRGDCAGEAGSGIGRRGIRRRTSRGRPTPLHLGRAGAQQDDYADAAKCLDRAVKIRRQSLPASHPDLADALDAYAAALRQTTPPQDDRADAMQNEAKKIRDKHAEEDVAK